jgi:putative PIN family toxin of toxin-antitoxin system
MAADSATRGGQGEPMEPIQVVVDTNVLVAAVRSSNGASNKLLLGIGDPRWEINISTALLLEYESALKRTLKEQGRPLALADEAVDGMLSVARRQNIAVRYRPILSDPGDDFVLELAVEAGAAYVITFNTKDFKGLNRFGIHAVRPSEFLKILEGCP